MSEFKVLYIAGSGRCGSTLLDNILGQLPGVCAVGEVRSLWEIGLLDGRRCGCGKPTAECPFWDDVLRRGFEHGAPRPEDVVSLQRHYLRIRPSQLARLIWASLRGAPPTALLGYLDTIERLYGAIAASAGARLIVDSSKGPGDAFAIAKFTDVDLKVLHLVRDPRGVAHSWSRAKRADDDRPNGRMKTMGPLTSSTRWLAFNCAIEAMLRPALGAGYLRVRWEDFVARPSSVLAEIMEFADLGGISPPLEDGRMVIEPTHSPSGNPDRVGRAEIRISDDQRWTREMNPSDRVQATLLALPLLGHYGYTAKNTVAAADEHR